MSISLLRITPDNSKGEASPVDPIKLLSGQPQQMTDNKFTNTAENFFCGVWSSDTGKWTVNYEEDEFCYLISGKAIVTDADGQQETIIAGDAFVIPAGFSGTWETIGEAKKFYAIYEA